MKRKPIIAAAILVPMAAALVAGLWWVSRPRPPAATGETAPETVVRAPASPPSAPAAPAIRYPIEAAPSEPSAAPLDVQHALDDLFGARTVASMFQLDDFARRFVATIDNLGRANASARLWPVVPAAGRFSVDGDGGAAIAAANAARYEPFVRLIETVDLRRAAAAYVQLYPSLQRAYEELGFPKGYFNDRFVEVVDLLLATPEPASPPRVHLPTVNGPVQPQRPWVLYEFDDPELEALTAGQKILVRMGVRNERRVKARLAELRGLIAPTRR